MQSVWLLALEHLALQLPVQLAWQLAEQSNAPGSTAQSAWQPPVHDAVHSTDTSALHDAWSWALHATSKLMGVHCAVQPPSVLSSHCASAVTLMFPQDSIPA